MIRNKRTTFATCINSEETLTARSTVPRLAGPTVDDTMQFHFPAEIRDCPSGKSHPGDNPFLSATPTSRSAASLFPPRRADPD